MKKAVEEDNLDPDDRQLKIEDDYKKAQIVALRVDTLSKYLKLGFPVRFALEAAGIELSESEIKSIETSGKFKKSKK